MSLVCWKMSRVRKVMKFAVFFIWCFYRVESTCQMIQKNQLSFCWMVDYATSGTPKLDDDAYETYKILINIVDQFDCRETFSLHTCDDCKEAYKYWLCSIQFPRCGGLTYQNATECVSPGVPDHECTNTNDCCKDGKRKTCISMCQDVIRKCPYTVQFSCPEDETRDYSPDPSTCNMLDRATHPLRPEEPFPSTFTYTG